jgi:phosphoadenosine phosphosulfate reductase
MSQSLYKIYWDAEKKAPIILNVSLGEEKNYPNATYMSTDLRPVFLEEKNLLKTVFDDIDDSIFLKSVWAAKGAYFFDGIKEKYSLKKQVKQVQDLDAFRSKIASFSPSVEMLTEEKKIFKRFIDANYRHMNSLIESTSKDSEGHPFGADPFIKEQVKKLSNRTVIVSFSGGKDSIVVSHLVRKALNMQEVPHVFADTTLELPNTYPFIQEFQEENDRTPFLIEKNEDANFFEMCKEIGPPSRVKSWCCSIFKTGPMGTTFSEMDIKLLTFYGIRRHESASRSKYERVTQSPKLETQKVASPIIDWLDIDIWLYIFAHKLKYNPAYRFGFSRVGCWCCPNNSEWSDMLAKIYYPKEYDAWYDFLIGFAKQIGKPDFEKYINDGKWKARQGGAGLDSTRTKINAKDCTGKSETAKTYQLTRPINSDFFELFKPFGEINNAIGKRKQGEINILNRKKETIFKIIAKEGELSFRVIVVMTDSKELNKQYVQNLGQYFWNYIDNQIRKFQSCIYCKACNGACPVSAIKVDGTGYHIDERLCVHCLKCVNHFQSGCLIASALGTKKQDEVLA